MAATLSAEERVASGLSDWCVGACVCRLREQAQKGVFKYRGMWQSLALIAKEEVRTGNKSH
jgi:hypothetical protein